MIAEMADSVQFHNQILIPIRQAVRNRQAGDSLKFAFLCNHGRHRSVSALRLVAYCLEADGVSWTLQEPTLRHPHDLEGCEECTGNVDSATGAALLRLWLAE